MIKIEVTGSSLAEVADKLLAIGASLQGRPAPMDPIMPEVAEMATSPEPRTSETSAPSPGTSSGSASPQTEQPPESARSAGATESPQATTPPSAATTSAPAAIEQGVSADDMKELVLSVVRVKGRDAVLGVLDTFGAAKASDVAAEQVPELVAALQALL